MPRRYRLALTLLAAAALCAAAASAAQPTADVRTGQHPQTLRTEATKAGEVRYLLYVPEAYPESKQRWPLVLFLHGLGESGDDLEKVKVHGPPKLIAAGKHFPFICASPQCPKGKWWSSPDRLAGLAALLDHIQKTLRVDPDRVYLTGLSMGGFGTWALAMAEPKRFAAIADKTVPTRHSEEMVEALKAAGGNPKLTIYPDAGHDSWTRTYDNPDFWKWLLAQRRKK